MQQELQQNQKQTLSTNQIQSLTVLAMDNVELSEFIRKEYEDNPVLEITQPEDGAALKTIGDNFRKTDYYTSSSASDKEQMEVKDTYDAGVALQSYLMAQLYTVSLTPSQWKIMDFLIESLSPEGFLETTAQEISIIMKMPLSQILICIELLQSLEPAGVGAADFRQALILQAKRINRCDEILIMLIESYLPQIAAGQFNKISKDMHINRKVLSHYIEFLKTLHPKPCRHFGHCQTQYTIPDIIFSQSYGVWNVTINDTWCGSIGINRLYLEYSKNYNNAPVAEYIEKKIARAKFVTQCIDRRHATLENLCQYILERQIGFISGQGPLDVMSAKEVAQDMGLNPSTISRAIKDKLVQTPFGVYPLKVFFEKSISANNKNDDTDISRDGIKRQLVQMIRSEPPNKPYSDSLLVKLFLERGIRISRRTIVQYREECGIKIHTNEPVSNL